MKLAVSGIVAAAMLASFGQATVAQTANDTKWDSLTAAERERALDNYERYLSLTPEERRDFEARYELWQSLTAERRQQMRERWQERPPEDVVPIADRNAAESPEDVAAEAPDGPDASGNAEAAGARPAVQSVSGD